MFLFLIKVEELGLTKKNKKRILNLLLLLLIIGGTFYLLLKDQELGAVMSAMERAKKLPLVIGIGLVIFFVCCESFIIHYFIVLSILLLDFFTVQLHLQQVVDSQCRSII